MQDIADAAGVSRATVSYVLNHSPNQTISHETRLKIFELSKKMNYIPNMSARALVNKRSHLIGIILPIDPCRNSFQWNSYYHIVQEIQYHAIQLDYDSIIIFSQYDENDLQIISKRAIDGVIAIDADTAHLYSLTNHYYVPIVFIDSAIEDPIFHEVLSNYKEGIQMAKGCLHNPILLMDDRNNERIKQTIQSSFAPEDIFLYRGEENPSDFLSRFCFRDCIVFGETLSLLAEREITGNIVSILDAESHLLRSTTRQIVISSKQKAHMSVNVLHDLMNFPGIELEKHQYIHPTAVNWTLENI